jgi:hypothetical protein
MVGYERSEFVESLTDEVFARSMVQVDARWANR